MSIENLVELASELGKKSNYDMVYNPGRLLGLARASKRLELGIESDSLPFFGYDVWNHYEVSWLNLKGKPMVAVAEIYYDCTTPKMIESKSLKLYFNSFNHSQFESSEDLQRCIVRDLSECLGGEVRVALRSLHDPSLTSIHAGFVAENIDDLDVVCSEFQVNPNFLQVGTEQVEESLSSDLLKSNCLVTHQPDWGSVLISYQGLQIDKAGLLKYLVSFRNHNEFHEQCIERIFMDIMQRCQPQELTVYGRYTRRGGLDINPYRSTKPGLELNHRLLRQ